MGDAVKQSGFSSASTTGSDAAMSLPRVFGRLLLLKLIARGGMGDVYLAATTGIEGAERPVVVKTVRRDHVHDGSFLARFLDEARVQSQLHHPGVAQVLEASTDGDGEPYTVVEYIEGRSLSEVRTRVAQNGQKILWPEACAIALEMAQGLAHVHDRAASDGSPLGIVHRDLSPQNVMVGFAGDVKLIDFGTARGHNRRCHTVAGVVFAKPGYVAPEVARQEVGDGRIDLYALGVMLWELVAGRRYYGGDPQKHLEDAAGGFLLMPSLAEMGLAPPELDEIVRLLTESEPDDRYASASQAAADLAKVLSNSPSTASGERGVRARVASLMQKLWPGEPARARSEFARLLKEARALRREQPTPVSTDAMEAARLQSEADPQMLPGTPYRLLETIGEGASGTVYEAEHIELGRRAAVKLLSAGHASATDAIERFRREARAVASLAHPNLVHLYDFGRSNDGRIFLAMEMLRGETLHSRVAREGQLEWREAVRVGIEVTHALEAAHEAGLVHRDLKPANLFLTELKSRDSMRALPLDVAPQSSSQLSALSSRSMKLRDGQTPSVSLAVKSDALPYGVKLLDFGVAMAMADTQNEEKKQRGFAVFGTPEYMAPEQVAGETVDGRCDLYALGCVLYELVTGTRPFVGPSAVVVMGKQLREEPEAMSVRTPGVEVPAALEALISKAMSKSAENRFADAAELRAALEETLAPVEAATQKPKSKGTAKKALRVATTFAAVGLAAFGFVRFEAARHSGSDFATASAAMDHALAPLSTLTSALAPAPAAAAPVAPADSPEATNVQAFNDTNDPASVPAVTTPAAPVAAPMHATILASASTATAASHAKEPSSLEDARTAAHAHVKDAHAQKNWATAAVKAGDMIEARHAAEAWEKADATSEPRLFLANVLNASGHHEAARTVLQNWLDDHPESTDARKLYAHLGGPAGMATASIRKSSAR